MESCAPAESTLLYAPSHTAPHTKPPHNKESIRCGEEERYHHGLVDAEELQQLRDGAHLALELGGVLAHHREHRREGACAPRCFTMVECYLVTFFNSKIRAKNTTHHLRAPMM